MKSNAVRIEAESPAKITDAHVQDRVLHKGDAHPTGWRVESVLDRAFENHKLEDPGDKNPKERALLRYEAGTLFTEMYLVSQPNFPGGSDYNRVRVVGVPGSFCDIATDVKRKLGRLRQAMGPRDYRILELVCGHDHAIAKAVIAVTSPSYRDSTLARFREALDCLLEGLESVRRA